VQALRNGKGRAISGACEGHDAPAGPLLPLQLSNKLVVAVSATEALEENPAGYEVKTEASCK
jgi:hypothetical protein